MLKLISWKKYLSLSSLLFFSAIPISPIAATTSHPTRLTMPSNTLLAASRRCYTQEMRIRTPGGGRLNIRANNNPNSRIVATLPNGAAVWRNSWDQSGQWANVSYPGNIRGWVWADYLACAPRR